MSSRSAIYSASKDDSSEVRRALEICLAGMSPPAVLSCRGGFTEWAAHVFVPKLAPHAMLARELALRGEAGLLARADAALRLPEASAAAGRELLSRREGARYLPVNRRFAAAVAAGDAPGHFATVLALQAAGFSLAVLPLLQCLLYCEWRAAMSVDAPRGLSDFLLIAAPALAALPALITPHDHAAAIPRLTAVR